MPFKRAVVLLLGTVFCDSDNVRFQCPLSGQLCCCAVGVLCAPVGHGFNAL